MHCSRFGALPVATMTTRNLDDDVKARLRMRAALPLALPGEAQPRMPAPAWIVVR